VLESGTPDSGDFVRKILFSLLFCSSTACMVNVPTVATGTFACASNDDCDRNFACVGQVCRFNGGGGTTAGGTNGGTTGGSNGGTTGGNNGSWQTSLSSGPTATSSVTSYTNQNQATFYAYAQQNGFYMGEFDCALDTGGFFPCTSPYTVSFLQDGPHAFRMRGANRSTGAVDPNPATWIWSVDTTPPVAQISINTPMNTSSGTNTTTSTSLSFNTYGSDAGSGNLSFNCSIDGSSPVRCVSPIDNFTPGMSHTLHVWAQDGAGNIEGQGITYSWYIANTTVSTPIASVSLPAVVGVDGVQPNITCTQGSCAYYMCSVDGGSTQTCSSSQLLYGTTGTNDRVHKVRVYAYDNGGNSDPVGTEATWVVAPEWVGAGSAHSCNAKPASGALRCVGANRVGQLGDGAMMPGGLAHDPVNVAAPSGTSFATVQAGGGARCAEDPARGESTCGHTCGIATDGGLYCWGKNDLGQLGIGGGPMVYSTPQRLDATTNWAQISLGGAHTCGLRTDHTLWCWGDNSRGQLGIGNPAVTQAPTPQQVGGTYLKVSAGNQHTCAIQLDGQLFCWGSNDGFQLAQSSAGPSYGPGSSIAAPTSSYWSDVSAGGAHTCGLTTSGQLYCWGRNGSGQLGFNPSAAPQTSPTQVNTAYYKQVSAGGEHTCAVRSDDTLWCWGSNRQNQVGIGSTVEYSANTFAPMSQVDPGGFADWLYVSSGANHTCGVRRDGGSYSAHCWGSINYGQTGRGMVATGGIVSGVSNWANASAIALGGDSACGLNYNGSSYQLACWGDNRMGQLGTGDFFDRPLPSGFNSSAWSALSMSPTFACGLYSSWIYCWGDNAFGQLGTQSGQNTPGAPVDGLGSSYTTLATGETHACAIQYGGGGQTGGPVYCWGSNSQGQRGDSSFDPGPARVISGGYNYTAVAAGPRSTCAVRTDNVIDCFGDNSQGQLGGQPSQFYVTYPTAVPQYSPVSGTFQRITMGFEHACALTDPGLTSAQLWCWGGNTFGQLGGGTAAGENTVPSSSMMQVPTPHGGSQVWVAVAAGAFHTCAIAEEAGATALYCWGSNHTSQINQPESVLFTSRVDDSTALVDNSQSWAGIYAGYQHTCALRADNQLLCWGSNLKGQLGIAPPSLGPSNAWTPYQAGMAPTF
jgi:alpha-tubulin suppressor-like RCC1 family protein